VGENLRSALGPVGGAGDRMDPAIGAAVDEQIGFFGGMLGRVRAKDIKDAKDGKDARDEDTKG